MIINKILRVVLPLLLFALVQATNTTSKYDCSAVPNGASVGLSINFLYDSLRSFPASSGHYTACFTLSIPTQRSVPWTVQGSVSVEVRIDSVPSVHLLTLSAPFEIKPKQTAKVALCFDVVPSTFYKLSTAVSLACNYMSLGYSAEMSFLDVNQTGQMRLLHPKPNGRDFDLLVISSNVTSSPARHGLYRAAFQMQEFQTWGLPEGVKVTVAQILAGAKQQPVVVAENLLATQGQGMWGKDNLPPQNVSFDVSPSSVYLIETEGYFFCPVYLYVGEYGNMSMKTQRSVDIQDFVPFSWAGFFCCMAEFAFTALFGATFTDLMSLFF